MVYIDPPFASKQDFSTKDQKAYADKLKGAEFLEWLRKRLILLREVMSNDGTIYVHMDWHKVHYVKVLMDEIFGEGNFRNEIIWHYQTYQGQVSKYFPRKHDTLLVYGKTSETFFQPQKDGNPESTIDAERWREFYVDGWKIKGGNYPVTDSRFDGYLNRFVKLHGRMPNDEEVIWINEGQTVDDVWNIKAVDPKNKTEKVGYPTQKPEELLTRIISANTKPGDLVLDVFGGSGTTAAVSEKMNRRWITVDVGKLSIYTIQKRILGIDQHSPFEVYNAGHYDENKLSKFTSTEWKKFALALYDAEWQKSLVKGFEFEGIKDGDYVKVFAPDDFSDGSQITEDTLAEIYSRLGSSIGSDVYVIAPQGKFGFAVDEYDHEGDWTTVFNILRVPYSMMQKFTEDFSAIRQADDVDSVNDAVDAVGFDFIRPPKVDFSFDEEILTINSFEAYSRIKGKNTNHGFEAFSMLLIDFEYDGKVFDFDTVYFNKDFDDTQSTFIKLPDSAKRVMFIFVDKFGNELKVEQGM